MGSRVQARRPPGRAFVVYARLLGPLLGGYLLFDRAFAYVHVPGTPGYIGEMVLAVGAVGALTATGYLRDPVRDEPILSLLAVFMLWGLIRTVPELGTYGFDAVRDAALWYYCLFAFFAAAALARSPDLLERLVHQAARLTPWLLVWLPVGLLLTPLEQDAPSVPFTTVSVLSHKANNAAIAALVVLGVMWLFPGVRSARSRAVWSTLALVVIALAATQSRGGLLGVAAGATVGLVFVRERLRLIVRAVAVSTLGLGLAVVLPITIPSAGEHGRAFSASQLVANVQSLGGGGQPHQDLEGTVAGRQQLWSRILHKQVTDGHLADGSGFGPNLAAQVHVYNQGDETLRNPHNSHLDILARMGVVGLSLWIALWAAWYWRMFAGCRRLAREGLNVRGRMAVWCSSTATAILVSSFFDPQLEGPQVAALLWTAFGVGVAVTSTRGRLGDARSAPAHPWKSQATASG